MLWLSLALLASPAAATEPAAELPAVVVLERRGFDPDTGAGSSVRIDEKRGRLLDADALLAHETGVTVRSGGAPGFSAVSIRGSDPGQVPFYLNGVPLPSSATGLVSVALFPLDALERVDVYRGAPPPRFARAPLGGAVDVVTRDPRRAGAGLRLGAGSFGRREMAAWAPAAGAGGHWLAGGRALAAANDFTYADDGGTTLVAGDDRLRRRANNDTQAADLYLLTEHRVGGGVLRGHALGVGANQGLAGFANDAAGAARLDTRLWTAGLGYEQALDEATASLAAFGGALREHFHDPHGELAYAPTDQLGLTDQGGLRAAAEWSLGRWRPEAALEGEGLRYRTGSPGGRLPVYHRQRAAAAGALRYVAPRFTALAAAQAEWDRLTADGAVDRDGFHGGSAARARTLPSVRAGGSLRLVPGVQALFNAGSAYRMPTPQEQFGNRGTQLGNPGLRPETGWYGDAGLQWERATRKAAWLVDLRYFRRALRDVIAVYQSTPKTTRAENFDSALAAGYELSAQAQRGRWRLGTNATYQAVVNTGPIDAYHGKQLPGRPRWEAGGDAAYLGRYLEPAYAVDAQGDLFLDPVNTQARRIARRTYHHAALTAKPAPWLRATASVENLSDERSQDYVGFPLPGRSYGLVFQFTSTP